MKKMNTLLAVAALSLIATATTAVHANEWYGQTSLININADSGSDKFKGNGISLLVGKNVGSGLSIEGQMFQQMSAAQVQGAAIKLGGFGVYAKYTLDTPLPAFKPYARVGASTNTVNSVENGVTEKGSESSLSFGGGVNYSITPKLYVNMDLTQYHKKNNATVTGVSAGLGFKF
jgi:opacity protein-like surface antigen